VPLAIPGRTKDAVVVTAADTDWRSGVTRFLRHLGAEEARVTWHVDVLEQRQAGRLSWVSQLAGRTLPSGRPMPPRRAYAEMLVKESSLPLYDAGGWSFSIDLHNPDNEAGVRWYDDSEVELAIVADQGAFIGPAAGPGRGIEEAYRQRAANGARLGDLVAALAEHVEARFGYADVGSSGGLVASAGRPTSVVHPGPETLRPDDFLWSITLWGPGVLTPEFEDRLDRLALDPVRLDRVDPSLRRHVRLERRHLGYGARMLQYRFLFGSELRGERASIDTPLAEQLGLRSTNLQYPA
jgi:hypothetical protein